MLNRMTMFVALMQLGPVPQAAALLPSPEVDACLQAAAAKHGISYVLLRAISEQESGFNPRALGKNSNGSYDMGLMQINSAWLPTLQKYGIKAADLYEPCVSADVSAWLLASNFKSMGVTWRAVGAYNAGTEWKRVRYAVSVHSRIQKYLQGAGRASALPAQTPVPSTQEASVAQGSMVAWEGEHE